MVGLAGVDSPKGLSGEWSRVPRIVQRDLEVGLYQVLFLDRVPDYAAVNEAVNIATETEGKAWGRVVNGVLRKILRRPDFVSAPPVEEDPVLAIAVRWSHPRWLVRRWVEAWGVDRTLFLCRANNERPRIGIRVNRLRTTREEIVRELRRWGVEVKPVSLLDTFVTVEGGGDLTSSDAFKRGLFYIQDVSAGLVGHLVDPQPGERILDLAAAPGGKTTHMAELADDRTFIVAVDRNPSRIRKVWENRDRLGLKGVFPVVADGCRMEAKRVDKVLVDAPCSALGLIRRRGELRWRRKPEEIPTLVAFQKALLEKAATLVRTGGVLVYSTCTILPEENEEMIDAFLTAHSDFVVEDARRFVDSSVVSDRGFVSTWTDRHGMDGSFAARLKKVE